MRRSVTIGIDGTVSGLRRAANQAVRIARAAARQIDRLSAEIQIKFTFDKARFQQIMKNLGKYRGQIQQFREGIQRAIPTNLLSFGPPILALIAIVAGLTAALIGLVSSLALASGALVAILPLAVAASSVFGVFALASKQIKASQPWKELTKDFERLQRVVYKQLAPGLNRLFDAVGRRMPQLTASFGRLGRILGEVSARVGRFIDGAMFKRQFTNILKSNEVSVRNLGNAFLPLARIFITLTEAAGPLAERFTELVSIKLTNFMNFLEDARDTGELAEFFRRAGEEMGKWGRIIRNILGGIGNVLRAGIEPGQRYADSLERITARFRDWSRSAEGAEDVKAVITFIQNIDYKRLLQIAAAISAIGLAIKGLVGLGAMLQGLTALAALGPVGLVLGLIAAAIGLIVGGMVYLYQTNEQFRKEINDNLVPALKAWWAFLQENIFPALEKIAKVIGEGVLIAFDMLSAVIRDNKGELEKFSNFMVTILPYWGQVFKAIIIIIAAVIAAIVIAVGWIVRLFEGIATAISYSWMVIQRIGTAIKDFFVNILVPTIYASGVQLTNAWGAVTRFFVSMNDSLKRAAQQLRAVWQAIVDFFTGAVSNAFRSFASAAGSAMNNFRSRASSVASAVRSTLSSLVSFITGIPGRIRSSLNGAFGGAFDGLVSAARAAVNAVLAQLSRIPGGSAIAGAIGGFLGRATGGPVFAGMPYQVGREVFTPAVNGRIYTPSQWQGGADGGGSETIELTLDIDLGEGITQRVTKTIDLKNRDLKRQVRAGRGRR